MIRDLFITDFTNSLFKAAFVKYFSELGIKVTNWDGLWAEMNKGDTVAYMLVLDEQQAVGFIQCQIIKSASWFFEEKYGFIREFWIDDKFRNQGYGSELLDLAEKYFVENGVVQSILTTDTAEHFYVKHGYRKRGDIVAKNKDDVFVKMLQPAASR